MNSVEISCPAKTFILGEYGVLDGGPAIVINTAPRFQCSFSKNTQTKTLPSFPKKSPVSQWVLSHREDFKGLSIKWRDPFLGKGGMGFSSAQFNMLYAYSLMRQGLALDQISPQKLWRVYREMEFEGWVPSGADVVSQWVGGVCLFQQDPLRVRTLTLSLPSLECLIARTGQRLNTHEHLKNLKLKDTSELKDLAIKGIKAFEHHDEENFLKIINNYGLALASQGFVTDNTKRVLENLKKVPEIKAAKGCGAMGAEVIIVFYKSEDEAVLKKKLSSMEILADSSKITYGVEAHGSKHKSPI